MKTLAIIALCIFSAYLGASYADQLPGYTSDAEKKISELKAEMKGKVEILGEKTVELHDKLKRCLDEKSRGCEQCVNLFSSNIKKNLSDLVREE